MRKSAFFKGYVEYFHAWTHLGEAYVIKSEETKVCFTCTSASVSPLNSQAGCVMSHVTAVILKNDELFLQVLFFSLSLTGFLCYQKWQEKTKKKMANSNDSIIYYCKFSSSSFCKAIELYKKKSLNLEAWCSYISWYSIYVHIFLDVYISWCSHISYVHIFSMCCASSITFMFQFSSLKGSQTCPACEP